MKRTNPLAGAAYVLTSAERDVMEVLAEGHTGVSVIRLSADLYQRGSDSRFSYGDPIGFVTWLLEELDSQGFVTYRVPADNAAKEDAPGFAGLPYHVRLTAKGWAALGYVHILSEVGRTARFREVRPADVTDYRNHQSTAKGGPITRHWWWECALLKRIHSQEEPMSHEDRRAYHRVTPEMEERVIASYMRTGSYAKTAQEANVDLRRVRYIVNDRPRLGRDAASLKQQVLELIRENGPYPDVMSLHNDIPGPHGLHNLVHVLHSLHKGQLIDFRTERSRTGSGTNYLAIKARDVVPQNGKAAEPELALTSELPVTEDAKPVTEVQFPELQRLLSQESETKTARAKASQYIQAAESLADVDPDMAETLLAKAAEVDDVSLNPVESEYLTYAKAHPHD